ncbi:transcription elongation factor, mitochondrial [Silurus meridionalis]|uniref:transcription elongation factor, mitochondrial n=1 Tax=Silurus meridionalis TaxID=175797 RepID=UPI001EEA99F2|nr:transcription elongation factor, mitochondrial [Silurus meridionalis]
MTRNQTCESRVSCPDPDSGRPEGTAWRLTLQAAVSASGPLSPLPPLPEFSPRFLQCTYCWTARIPAADLNLNLLRGEPSEPLCRRDDAVAEVRLDSLYTPEQRDTILQLLNTGSESELAAVKMLRGRKSANIVAYRVRNGPFKDLESVVNVPLLKHKSAVVAFNSILCPTEKKEKRKGKIHLAKFIRPEVDKALLEDSSSIVSIVCGTNRIAWTHMDRAMTVLEWQQEDCHNFMKGTYMASGYLDDVCGVVSNLPAADFYVVEKPSVSVQNTALFPVVVHLRTVEAMLFALLNSRRCADGPPVVLNMMRTAVGRHFGLIVGESRTSGAEVVRKMMAESAMKKIPRVIFPNELLVRYSGAFHFSSRNKGQEMCDALLQAVAFYELLSDSH